VTASQNDQELKLELEKSEDNAGRSTF